MACKVDYLLFNPKGFFLLFPLFFQQKHKSFCKVYNFWNFKHTILQSHKSNILNIISMPLWLLYTNGTYLTILATFAHFTPLIISNWFQNFTNFWKMDKTEWFLSQQFFFGRIKNRKIFVLGNIKVIFQKRCSVKSIDKVQWEFAPKMHLDALFIQILSSVTRFEINPHLHLSHYLVLQWLPIYTTNIYWQLFFQVHYP